jgi:tetratricopeptide (TPR) repeat protein
MTNENAKTEDVDSLFTQAEQAYGQGNTDEARAFLSTAAQAVKEHGELPKAPGWLHKLGTTAYMAADYQTARELLEMALEYREQVHPETFAHAMTLLNLGAVAWKQDRRSAAFEYFDRCLEIQQKISAPLKEIDRTYLLLVTLLHEMGPEFEEKYKAYRIRSGEVRLRLYQENLDKGILTPDMIESANRFHKMKEQGEAGMSEN